MKQVGQTAAVNSYGAAANEFSGIVDTLRAFRSVLNLPAAQTIRRRDRRNERVGANRTDDLLSECVADKAVGRIEKVENT
jgi:hypothetical protein